MPPARPPGLVAAVPLAALPLAALPLAAPPLASLGSDLTLLGCLVVAEALVLFATWSAEALERHGRSRLLELAQEAGVRSPTEARLLHAGAHGLSVRLLRFVGSAVLVVGIALVALRDRLQDAGGWAGAFPWGALGAALAAAFLVNFVVNDLLMRLLVRRNPERFLLVALPWLELARWVTLPVRLLLVALARWLFRVDLQDPGTSAREEVRESVEEGEREGSISSEEAEMIESIIDLDSVTAEDVLTPRGEMSMIAADATLAEAITFVLGDGHSRIPVYGKDRDDVVGVLYAHDLLAHARNGTDGLRVRDVQRPAFFVPETKSLRDLLREMRARKVHLAIVIDEFGGTAGLVTIEDLLEQIVGEIEDEYDVPEAPPPAVHDGKLEVAGRTPIEEVNRALAVDLPVEEDFETVGGLFFHQFGKVPREGDRLELGDVALTVTEADERTVKRLQVQVIRPR